MGADESAGMRAAMKDYPLSLLFARADGAYEASVDVRIPLEDGDAVQWQAGGPVCLLQLAAGRYLVGVQGAGQSHRRVVRAGKVPHTLDFGF